MATFTREGNGLTATGELAPEEIDDLVSRGQELLDLEAPQVLIDIRKTTHQGSTFIGAIAQLGADARARSKSLIVRAEGQMADMLVWAGLHRIVTLYVSSSPSGPPPQ
jgi:anti-anti-sigma regulatory factor